MSTTAYDATIHALVAQYAAPGLNTALVKAIVECESQWNPRAYRLEAAINDASRGLMQVLYRTAIGTGWRGNPDDLFDPTENLTAGIRYLSGLLTAKGGDVWAAVSAYNNGNGKRATGPTKVCLARDSHGACQTYFTAQAGQFFNQPYVDRVQGAYGHYADDSTGLGLSLGTVGVLALAVLVAKRFLV